MLTFKPLPRLAFLFAATVFAVSTTGCSSMTNHAALSGMHAFSSSAHLADFPTGPTHAVPQRHVREHALTQTNSMKPAPRRISRAL